MKRFFTALLVTGAIILSSNQSQAQCYSAVQLDGTNEYMFTPFANYTFNTFTMEMWINSANFNPNEHYISLYQNSYIVLGGWSASGSLDTWANGLNPIAINSGTTPSINTWHHIAFVFDGTSQILYIDGVAVVTTITTGAVTNNAVAYNSGLVIGARHNQTTQYTNTAFDDVRIWNVARTPTELANNMNINLAGNEAGLVAYYTFEDGLGSTTVTDLTGNGNTLTLNNMDPATDWISSTSPVGGPVQTIDVQSTCGPITWIDGNIYSANDSTATYTYVGGAASGCDSTVTLNLTINSASTSTDVLASCDSYTWIDSNVYTTSNNTATYTYVGGAANGCDSIVSLDLIITTSQQSTDVQSACDTYTWIDSNVYTVSNNTATYTYIAGAANGCDSIVSLNLTINTVDVTVTTAGLDLTSNEMGAIYQWVDCDSSFALIAGATNQLYTATSNGNYAVVVTGASGCLDTSACIAITTVSLDEVGLANVITLSPNPTSGEFSISAESYSEQVMIKVLDITGKLIFESTENLGPDASIDLDLSGAANGVYIVNVSDLNEVHSIRVIKK